MHFGIAGTKVIDEASLTVRYPAPLDILAGGSNPQVTLNGTAFAILSIQTSQTEPNGIAVATCNYPPIFSCKITHSVSNCTLSATRRASPTANQPYG